MVLHKYAAATVVLPAANTIINGNEPAVVQGRVAALRHHRQSAHFLSSFFF